MLTWTDHDNMSLSTPASGFSLQVRKVPIRQDKWSATALGQSVPGEFNDRESAKWAAHELAWDLAHKLLEGLGADVHRLIHRFGGQNGPTDVPE